MKICAKCNQQYDEAYDRCPHCARKGSCLPVLIAWAVVAVLLGCILVSYMGS